MIDIEKLLENPDRAQNWLNKTLITSSEITNAFNIQRSTILYAIEKGRLPKPLSLKGVRTSFWVRATIQKQLEHWESSLKIRKNGNLPGLDIE